MTTRKISCLFGLLSACLLLVAGCSNQQTQKIQVAQIKHDRSFYCEDIPFGTDYQTIFKQYYHEKMDPESDQFKEWRNVVTQPNGYRSLNPVVKRQLYDLEWSVNFGFDDTDALYMTAYNCTTEPENFEPMIEKLTNDCYQAFGDASLSQSEFLALVNDTANDQVGSYWTAEDGSYFQLYMLRTDNKILTSIVAGSGDSVELLSGAGELPGLLNFNNS